MPKLLTLCGSTRFEYLFHRWNEALTLSGHTVFSISSLPSIRGREPNEMHEEEERALLTASHFDKIRRSDGVVFLNKFAYMGEHALAELEYALLLQRAGGPEIYFLEGWAEGKGVGEVHSEFLRKAAAAAKVPEGFGSPVPTHLYGRALDLLGDSGRLRNRLAERLETPGPFELAAGGS